jgi:DNA-3-methyladenine glycosylase II
MTPPPKPQLRRQPATKQLPAPERIITADADVADGVAALAKRCQHIRAMADVCGPLPLRLREPGFEGLARIIVSQQLSVASAAAIWTRVTIALPGIHASSVIAATDEELRAAGLSRPKVKTLRAVATAVEHGLLDGLEAASNEQVHATLTGVSGIGPWTADIFLMFCLGRADGFPPGDLALQEAAKMIMQLDTRPTAKELAALAERWRPWRSVAARMLWAYYKVAKDRDGIGT